MDIFRQIDADKLEPVQDQLVDSTAVKVAEDEKVATNSIRAETTAITNLNELESTSKEKTNAPSMQEQNEHTPSNRKIVYSEAERRQRLAALEDTPKQMVRFIGNVPIRMILMALLSGTFCKLQTKTLPGGR